jgi:DNA-binding transcriptional LysR family regulator
MVISNTSDASQDSLRLGLQVLGRLRLKHLRLIDALERTGSLRKAAQELSLSQPAATKILQDLEGVVGVQLFHRHARAVEINDFGRSVAAYARRMLGETERFSVDLATQVRTGYARVSVGAIMVTAAQLMPAALLKLKLSRPGTIVRLVESSSDHLLADLANHEYDFVLARFNRPEDAVVFDLIPLSDEPLCVFAASGAPLPERVASLADLHEMQWVIQDSPTPTRQLLETAFARGRLPLPPHIVQTSSVYAMLNLVHKAGFIGVLPRVMVLNEGSRFQILPIDLKDKLTPYGIVTQRGATPSPAAQELIDILVGLARS